MQRKPLEAPLASRDGQFEDDEERRDEEKTKEAAELKTPQKVIDALMNARGEIECITELVNLMEQQQFLSVNHVVYRPHPEAKLQDEAIALQRRRQQLSRASARLHIAAEELQSHSTKDKRFIQDVIELRRHWNIARLPPQQGGDFFVHMSVRLPPPSAATTRGCVAREFGSVLQVLILPNLQGRTCIVLPPSIFPRNLASNPSEHLPKPRAIEGPQAIHEALQEQYLLHCWRSIDTRIEEEIQASREDLCDVDGSLGAVMQLVSRAILHRAHQSTATDASSNQEDDNAGILTRGDLDGKASGNLGKAAEIRKSSLADRIATFCTTPACQRQFEVVALQRLAQLMDHAEVPELVKRAREDKDKDDDHMLLTVLQSWLRNSSQEIPL